jgi:hypothetical protein
MGRMNFPVLGHISNAKKTLPLFRKATEVFCLAVTSSRVFHPSGSRLRKRAHVSCTDFTTSIEMHVFSNRVLQVRNLSKASCIAASHTALPGKPWYDFPRPISTSFGFGYKITPVLASSCSSSSVTLLSPLRLVWIYC